MRLERLAERAIAYRIVDDLIASGHMLGVDDLDGEGCKPDGCTNAATIKAALFQGDGDTLRVYRDGLYVGWIKLVWGNGVDCLSDYTTNLETVLADAHSLADAIERGECEIIPAPSARAEGGVSK